MNDGYGSECILYLTDFKREIVKNDKEHVKPQRKVKVKYEYDPELKRIIKINVISFKNC